MSKTPAFLPPDYREAKAFAHRYRKRQFFCGVYLGGCGWPLSLRLCTTKKSHWAHHSGAPECVRSGRDDSADHLYIHMGLVRLLGKAYGSREVEEQIEMDDERCLYTEITRETSIVRVQYSNLSRQRWEEEDRALRRRFTHVHWVIGPSASSTAELIELRKGWVLRANCRTRGGTRQVLVRVDGGAGRFDWIPLEECVIDENGRVTGHKLRAQRQLHREKHEARLRDQPHPALRSQQRSPAPAAAPAPDQPADARVAELVHPILERMEAAIERDDLGNLESHLTIRKRELNWLRHSGLAEDRLRLQRITTWHLERRNVTTMRLSDAAGSEGGRRDPEQSGHTTTRTVRDGWLPSRQVPETRRNRSGKLVRTAPTGADGKRRGKKSEQRARPAAKPAVPEPRAPDSPLPTGLAAKVEPLLREAARNGRTVSWARLPHPAGQKWQEMVHALTRVEQRNPVGTPLLTSLIVDDSNKVHRIFRDVLVRLGYGHISTDFGLDIAGKSERERVHAFHARPPRPIPDSALPKKK